MKIGTAVHPYFCILGIKKQKHIYNQLKLFNNKNYSNSLIWWGWQINHFLRTMTRKVYPRKAKNVGMRIAAIIPTIMNTRDTSTRMPTNFQNDFW